MDITGFENGLDVGEIAGVLAGEDMKRKKEVFSDLKDSAFLIPYNKTQTDIRLLKIPEKGEYLPAFTSYAEFMKSPLDHEKVVVLPLQAGIQLGQRPESFRARRQSARQIPQISANRRSRAGGLSRETDLFRRLKLSKRIISLSPCSRR
jgi:hypothetical protein